nr:DnaT-like ssDNA-binding protein [uncultured Undibacterium sp.]
MSLIVEDGTGKSDAESLCSLSDANAYHAARGNAAWGALASDDLREQSLRKATDFITQMYRLKWQGIRSKVTQALDWPRISVYIEDYPVLTTIVPTDVKNACAELALKASTTVLAADLKQGVKSKKVGPIETVYDEHSNRSPRYLAVERMLEPYFKSGGSTLIQVNRS